MCRVRPENKIERNAGGVSCVKHTSESIEVQQEERVDSFTFDAIHGAESTQEEVFLDTAHSLIHDVLRGYNATIFAYGQTGTGKTFTMEGDITDPAMKGIIPRTVEALFEGVGEAEETVEFTFKVSYVEIYMERIRDLLDETRSKINLTVREDKLKGIYIAGVTEEYVTSIDELYYLMDRGASNRATAATGMNEGSSRSHSVFTLTVSQRDTTNDSLKSGKLVLVDLAGSEMVRKTNASGQQLEEAKTINKSLSALGQVINALTDKTQTHVPYRDSKLTRVLQDSLGGNSKTVLIVNISPSSYNAVESSSTLRFGTRAKSIENKVVINQVRSVEELEQLLMRAEKAIDAQTAHIISLVTQLKTMQARIQSLEAGESDSESGSSDSDEEEETDSEEDEEEQPVQVDEHTLGGASLGGSPRPSSRPEEEEEEDGDIDAVAAGLASSLSLGGGGGAKRHTAAPDTSTSLDDDTANDAAAALAAGFGSKIAKEKPPAGGAHSHFHNKQLTKSHSTESLTKATGGHHHEQHQLMLAQHSLDMKEMQESLRKLQNVIDSLTEELDDERQETKQKDQQIQALTHMLREKDRLLHEAGTMLLELNTANEEFKLRNDQIMKERGEALNQVEELKAYMIEDNEKFTFNLSELNTSLTTMQQENVALKAEITTMTGDKMAAVHSAATAAAKAEAATKAAEAAAADAAAARAQAAAAPANRVAAATAAAANALAAAKMLTEGNSVAKKEASNNDPFAMSSISFDADDLADNSEVAAKRRDSSRKLKAVSSLDSMDSKVSPTDNEGMNDIESIINNGNTQFAAACMSLEVKDEIAANLFSIFEGTTSAMSSKCKATQGKVAVLKQQLQTKIKGMDTQAGALEKDLQLKIATVIELERQLDAAARGERGTAQQVEDAEQERLRQRSLQQRLEQLVAVHRQLLRKYGTLELECVELKKKTRLRDERIKHLETNAKVAIATGRTQADSHVAELTNLKEAMRLLKSEHEKRIEAFKQDLESGGVGGGAAARIVGDQKRTMRGGGGGEKTMMNSSFYKKSLSPSGSSFYKTSSFYDSKSSDKISSFNSFYFANSTDAGESSKNLAISLLTEGSSQKKWESNPITSSPSKTLSVSCGPLYLFDTHTH